MCNVAVSPRYTSSGQYATATYILSWRSRKYSSSSDTRLPGESRSLPWESDDNQWLENNGIYKPLAPTIDTKNYYETNKHENTPLMSQGRHRPCHKRRPSLPSQKPQITAPGHSSNPKISSSRQHEPSYPLPPAPPPEQKHRSATQKDAKKHQIPEGYSLSHWDPLETPIILAGSVFDANSLGKWIYDWVAHVHSGPEGREMIGIAGELWLLLIQISGKIKRADEVMQDIRTLENREMVDDFIESGERLIDKLRRLLQRCEGPMLSSSKTGKSKLGTTAGVKFVHTLLGREYELANTEKFMTSVRLWNLRFDANCEDIVENPMKK
ncbi:uncharacterized protein PpBr36_05786 [Pyricularia pennisetigena]|uniref:uncharacterized protein n=1 Tax=Pyricularia pennisetigena TaxID=1578925 RepID=UPI00114DBD07|nr:uncharacterized protein PpBr36_05786 [Pyricularia pennisetigena]TLS23443.1 hypothetical protein PpBr36_05786 [Pyricularia pennisetigena]